MHARRCPAHRPPLEARRRSWVRLTSDDAGCRQAMGSPPACPPFAPGDQPARPGVRGATWQAHSVCRPLPAITRGGRHTECACCLWPASMHVASRTHRLVRPLARRCSDRRLSAGGRIRAACGERAKVPTTWRKTTAHPRRVRGTRLLRVRRVRHAFRIGAACGARPRMTWPAASAARRQTGHEARNPFGRVAAHSLCAASTDTRPHRQTRGRIADRPPFGRVAARPVCPLAAVARPAAGGSPSCRGRITTPTGRVGQD